MTDLKKRGRPAASNKGRPAEVKPAAGRERPTQNVMQPAEVQRAESERPTQKKKERVSMARTRKLDYTPKQGYVARWVKDNPGRVQQCQEGGYEFVTDADGNRVTRPSGGSTLYLMEIPEQFFNEDKAAGQQLVTDITKEKVMGLREDEYVPEGHTGPLMRDKDLPI